MKTSDDDLHPRASLMAATLVHGPDRRKVPGGLCTPRGDPILREMTELPPSAIALFDGGHLDAWADAHGHPARWRLEDGTLVVQPGRGDIVTRRLFSDFLLHLEFWLPLMADASGQARANSGIYLQGRYELQVLDSFGQEPADDGCGALYKIAAPLVNACRPPEVWQSVDVTFSSCRPGGIRPRLTAFLNGALIHDDLVIPHPTGGALDGDETAPGPLRLQDHGCPVRYRNIWMVQGGPG